MLQLKYKNEFLDIAPDQDCEMEKNSPLFMGLDTLLAEYSTPIEIKYTDKNARLLGYFFFELNRKQKSSFEVEIYSNYTFITYSTLVIESAGMSSLFASKSSIAGYLLTGISSFFTYIKDKKLIQLNLGGARTLSYTTSDPTDGSGGYWQIFQQTWDFNNNYVVIPVRNEALLIEDPLFNTSVGWMNKLDSSNNLITSQPIFPFPKVTYILQEIFAEAGWTLDTSALNGTEWERLILFSNYLVKTNSYTVSGEDVATTPYSTITMYLTSAVPNSTCTNFILQLCKRYFWFPITDVPNKTVKFIALKDAGNLPTKDWTQWADYESSSDFSGTDRIFAFKNIFEGEDKYPQEANLNDYTIVEATGFEEPPNVGNDPTNIYEHTLFHTANQNKYYKATWDAADRVSLFVPVTDNIFDEAPENATDTYETTITTVALQKTLFDNEYYGIVPIVNHAKGSKWGIRTMLYHGLTQQLDSAGNPVSSMYPYASSINTPPSGSPLLPWSNVFKNIQYITAPTFAIVDPGIIEYWAKQWLYMISSIEIIKRNFYLPLTEIKNFQWHNIILVHNIPYLLKSYVEPLNKQGFIQATMQRIQLGEAPTLDGTPPPEECEPLGTGEGDWGPLALAYVGVPYLYTWYTSLGTQPTSITVDEAPSWMTITLLPDGGVQFSGTPTEALEEGIVQFTLNNCADIPMQLTRNDFFVFAAPPCDPIVLDTYDIPDATFGTPYVYDIMILSGTSPISITWVGLAGWLSAVLISGDTILRLVGTPGSTGTIPIDITLFNCNNSVHIDTTLTINP